MEGSDDSIQSKIVGFAKKNFILLALFGGGIIFLGVGFSQIMGQKSASIKFEKAGEVAGETSESKRGKTESQIKVDVEGEVAKPGVYTLNSGSRVSDAVLAAGGFGPKADRKPINLAQRILDGQKVYVPAIGEKGIGGINGIEGTRGDVQADLSSSGSQSVVVNGGLVSINSGTPAELDTLPSIGPVTAQKIINGRPYGTLEELVSKKAVGQKTFEKIRGLISL